MVAGRTPARGEVHLVSLNPTTGSDIPEDKALSDYLARRTQSTSPNDHRRTDDDGRPGVSVAGSVSLPAP